MCGGAGGSHRRSSLARESLISLPQGRGTSPRPDSHEAGETDEEVRMSTRDEASPAVTVAGSAQDSPQIVGWRDLQVA